MSQVALHDTSLGVVGIFGRGMTGQEKPPFFGSCLAEVLVVPCHFICSRRIDLEKSNIRILSCG
jgi:hypothetical protein